SRDWARTASYGKEPPVRCVSGRSILPHAAPARAPSVVPHGDGPGCQDEAMADDAWSDTRALGPDFESPGTDRWLEDYTVGDVREYGTITLREEDILDFARRYDPQSIHTDPQWAAEGPFDGLIASGIQTIGVFMRLYADHYLTRCGSLASPGVDEVRWP